MTRQERRKRRRQRRRRMQAGILAVLVVALGLIITLRAGKERETLEPEIPLAAERQSLTYIMPTPALPDARPAEETPDEPEELAEEPEPKNRYAPLHISDEDVYILACLVYHEARGECFEGQVAVIEVVLNRMLSDYFPDTVEEVVFSEIRRRMAVLPGSIPLLGGAGQRAISRGAYRHRGAGAHSFRGYGLFLDRAL